MVVAQLDGKNGFKIQIIDGNLLDEETDCIVNTANTSLTHSAGLAHEIAKKAGTKMSEECKAYIKKHGSLPTGKAAMTTAGDTRFKGIIHAVGPVWKDGKQKEYEELKNALESALQVASAQNITSISIPAISAGIFGYPQDQCTHRLIQVAIEFITNCSPLCSLKTIRFCDKDKVIVNLFQHNLISLGESTKITQVNSIREPSEVARQWQWQENSGQFIPFDPDQNYQIEVAYLKQKGKGKIVVTGDLKKVKNNYEYEINFDTMTELNSTYKRNQRKIQRVPKQISDVVWEFETNKVKLQCSLIQLVRVGSAWETRKPRNLWNSVCTQKFHTLTSN